MTALVVDACVWVSAADAADRFHSESRRFLRTAVEKAPGFLLPALTRVEIGCALARRLRDAAKAKALTAAILETPLVKEKSLDRKLLASALERGIELGLRGADAFYVAVAETGGCQLVSWDRELVDRAGAILPTDFR